MLDTRTIKQTTRQIMNAGYVAEYGETLPNLMGRNAGNSRKAIAEIIERGGDVVEAYCSKLGLVRSAFSRCSLTVDPTFRKQFSAMQNGMN